MPTYAIGDIQGCWATLSKLLERIAFDPTRDRLWLVGDLVNRGPGSLEVLRWARDLGDRVVAVLGNHDIKLLALSRGIGKKKGLDTLDAILEAPDREELLEWIRHRPLAHREGPWLMVHAGLFPQWTSARALELSEEVESVLRAGAEDGLLRALRKSPPLRWDEALEGEARLAAIVTGMTKLRACTADGEALGEFSGAPADIPAGGMPWYDVPSRRSRDVRVVFGHWSSQGLLVRDDVAGLDTGCVWGRELTALRLEDGAIVQEPCADPVAARAGV